MAQSRLPAVALAAGIALFPVLAAAQTFTPLYDFTGAADGAVPARGPLLDTSGRLFGPTLYGGNNCLDSFTYPGVGCGTLYIGGVSGVAPLVTFTGTNGAAPDSTPNESGGLLYGATINGGADNLGTVFTVNTDGTAFTQLYSFAGLDGANPSTIVRLDSAGNRVSVALHGGPAYTTPGTGWGVLFEITTAGQFVTEHAFTNGADGSYPGRIFLDKKNNVFGSTNQGGTCIAMSTGCGTVYEYAPKKGTFTTLYDFTAGLDGYGPALAGMDSKGNLYGYTTYGGQYEFGTLFELVRGLHNTYTYLNLYSFTGGQDGANPVAAPALTSTGALIGTTLYGPVNGANFGYGVAYSLTAGVFKTLHVFTNGTDGQFPEGTPAVAANGTILGTTAFGGIEPCYTPGGIEISGQGCGTIFSIKP